MAKLNAASPKMENAFRREIISVSVFSSRVQPPYVIVMSHLKHCASQAGVASIRTVRLRFKK
jgi:hypothetical protein